MLAPINSIYSEISHFLVNLTLFQYIINIIIAFIIIIYIIIILIMFYYFRRNLVFLYCMFQGLAVSLPFSLITVSNKFSEVSRFFDIILYMIVSVNIPKYLLGTVYLLYGMHTRHAGK